MAVDFRNLEWVRVLLSEKSPSDFRAVQGLGLYDKADASGCLAYINLNYKDNDKDLMKIAVDCYIGMESKQKLSEKLAGVADVAYTPKMAKKYSAKMGAIVADELVGKALSDRGKANTLGVSHTTYARSHANVFDTVFDVGFCALSNADDLAWQYLKYQRKS